MPGSGKSWFIKNNFINLVNPKNLSIVSRDAIRFNILDTLGGEYFTHEDVVWNVFIETINTALKNDAITDIVVDATHLTPKARVKVLNNFDLSSVSVNFICATTPLEICLERNKKRVGRERVPSEVIRNMYKSLNYPSSTELNNYKVKEIIVFDEKETTLLRKDV